MLFFVYIAIKFTLEVKYRIYYSVGLCYFKFTSKVNYKEEWLFGNNVQNKENLREVALW